MRHHRRLIVILVAAVVAVLVVAGLVLRSPVPFSSDIARTRIAAFLAERLDSVVELKDVKLRLWPRLRVEGVGLQIRHRGRRDVPPLISIAHFTAEGNLLNLLRRHISRLTVDGLEIEIPPDRNRTSTDTDRKHERSELQSGPRAQGIESGAEATASAKQDDRAR